MFKQRFDRLFGTLLDVVSRETSRYGEQRACSSKIFFGHFQ
jgi:hypothetical protein